MNFFWKNISCGGRNFKFIDRTGNKDEGDCVPTAIAMLVYNLKYGYGSVWGARRSLIYAQMQNKEERGENNVIKANNPWIVGRGTISNGATLSEMKYMLNSYGLTYEFLLNKKHFPEKSYDWCDDIMSINDLCATINGLKHRESLLITGYTPNGGLHCIAVLKSDHVLIALDRLEYNICWAHTGNGQTLAYIDKDNKIIIRGNKVGDNLAKCEKSKNTSLIDVLQIFKIPKQDYSTILSKSTYDHFSRFGQYFGYD